MSQTPPATEARRIGIHGTRNAGKTCFLGCLYGHRTDDEVTVACADDATILYLRGVWDDLRQQRVPAATAMGLPTELRLGVGGPSEQPPLAICLCDYAGALVQPLASQASPLARELGRGAKEWLTSAQAILFFLDSSQPELEQVDALDLLLTELARPRGDGPPAPLPLGLVLTKWDSHGPISPDDAHEEARARDYLRDQPVFGQVWRKLAEGGERVKVFPVSAFGNEARDNRPPPADRLRPCHIHAPLLWAARQADEVLLDAARAEAQRHLDRTWKLFDLPLLPRPDHAAALGVYDKLRRDYGVAQGPLAEGIRQEMGAIRASRRHHHLRRAAPFAAALALLLLGMGWLARSGAEQELSALEEYRQAHTTWEDASERRAQAEKFLSLWRSRLLPAARERVEEWCREDSAAADEQAACQAARQEGTRLEKEQKFSEAVAHYRGFTGRFPQSRYNRDFEKRVLDLLPVVEDRDEYLGLLRLAQRGNQPEAVEELDRRAKEYLGGPRPVKAMRPEVQAWQAWLERLRQGGEFPIVVESISIPSGSALDATFGATEPRVEVSLGGRGAGTRWFKGNEITMNETLGPYPFRWGEPGTLHVRVEGYHHLWRNDAIAAEVSDERFALRRANGPFVLRCARGKEVTVRLRCDAAVPPELPAYRRP
jgi:hypothetical protein